MEWIKHRARELSGTRSTGIHLTELIYCLTHSWFERLAPLPITNEAALTLAMGINLERTIIPLEVRASPGCYDGIDYSPDFRFHGNEPSELKTTRMSLNKTINRQFPETWIEQIKGYCKAEGQTTYHLAVVHLLGNYKPPFPALRAVTFRFSQQELDDQWNYIRYRREQYILAIGEQRAPEPLRWCKDWECANCAYRERCETLIGRSIK